MPNDKQISVVICSRNSDISEELKNNIGSTIGVEYELVIINNKHGEYNMFTAYNEGLKRSSCECLCFMHEDILFHSNYWGVSVLEHLKNRSIGVLGVMGGHFLPSTPTGWWEPGVTSENFICHLQDGTLQKVFIDQYRNDEDGVVAVDGAFMCFPRHIFSEITWDSEVFSDFHCYDVDICLQALSRGYIVQIAWDILLEHKSSGALNRQLVLSRKLLYNKWKSELPLQRGVNMTAREIGVHTELAKLRESEIEIKNSLEYRLGTVLLYPIRRVYNLFRLLFSNL